MPVKPFHTRTSKGTPNRGHYFNRRFARGVTLMEAMISLALSLIVTSAMVTLMGNSMGTATRIIQMSQLTNELRNAMLLVTRDVRRANYSGDTVYCYGNPDCLIEDDPSATQYADIAISAVTGANGSCITFGMDRDGDGVDADDAPAAFRIWPQNCAANPDDTSYCRIEMWIAGSAPNCTAASSDATWVAITDPGFVDITEFTVSDAGSITDTTEVGAGTVTQRARQVNLTMSGDLIMHEGISRTLVDEIRVRNDLVTYAE